MRIAIDTLFEHPDRSTGAIDYLRSVAGTFPKLAPEHDFYLFVSDQNFRHFREFEGRNLRFIQCYRSNENMPVRILIQQTLMPIQVKRQKIDVLFAPGNVCPFWGNFCRVLKINTLHQYHTPELVGSTRSVYRKFFFEESARRATHILANTAMTKNEICKFMAIPEHKVTVTGEAFYDIYSKVSEEQIEMVLAKHELRRDYILFVSSLYAYKNVETLIKAFAHLAKQQPSNADTQLVIVGRDYDSLLPKLRPLNHQLGISDRVRFLGFVPTEDIPALYSGANVFVFPSLIETFGKPLVEAMRCGVPIVASNTSCIPEVLGDSGLLVDPLDVEEMAGAILRVRGDEGLRTDMIARGLERAESFSWENGARNTLAVIERAYEDWKRTQVQSAWVHGS
jgi:glycosyltransferase involved in cell wall biosynthesis